MNCIIPGLNLKVVAKGLHALAKVGDDLYIEARKDKLCLVSLNLRKTVCVQFYLLDSFFSSYETDHSDTNKDDDAIACKIHMKTLLPLFKGTHLDKKFDYIKIMYENNSDVLVLKMKYRCEDILMIHNLRLMDSETLTIDIQPDAGSCNIVTASALYNQLLGLFSNHDDEITLEISKQKVIARNYCVGAPIKPKSVRSQVNLNSYEFNIYQISNITNINFSLKPFRTAIQFAEGLSLNIGLNFERGGKPLALIMRNPTFELSFLIATVNPYSDAQSSMATSSIPAKITQHIVNLTQEDHEALQEDWNDCEMEEISVKAKKRKKNKTSPFQDIVNTSRNSKTSNGSIDSVHKNKNKIFSIPEDSSMDVDQANDLSDCPMLKKTKIVFGRCLESTFSRENSSEVLAPNSDSE